MTTTNEWVEKLRRAMSIYKTGPDGVSVDFVGNEVAAIGREAAEEMRERCAATHPLTRPAIRALPLPGDEVKR